MVFDPDSDGFIFNNPINISKSLVLFTDDAKFTQIIDHDNNFYIIKKDDKK